MSSETKNINTSVEESDNISETKIWTRNFILSLLIHIVIIISLLFIYDINQNKAKVNPDFLYVDTKEYENPNASIEKISEDKVQKENELNQKDKISEDTKFISFSDLKTDTTNLDQVYKESTLNVTIKYPKGWTYIDQNKNKRLDGVTFWAADGNYNPPPYLHLEVIDKYLFNEKRYKYKLELKNCDAYYNDPEEIAGQIAQTFYLKTDSDEDYQIKLIMNGVENFKSFQPKFWAILESFRFGSSLF